MTKSIDVVPTWYWPDGVPRTISLPRSPIHRAVLERWARRSPDAIAVQSYETALSYRDLQQRSETMAARLRRLAADRIGDDRGRLRVGLFASWNVADVSAVLGVLQAGVDALLLDPSATLAETEELVKRHRLDVLVTATSTRRLGEAVDIGSIEPLVGSESPTQVSAGRLGLVWEESVVFHAGEPLLAWALAFRAFAEMDKQDLFTVHRPLVSWEGVIGLLAPLAVGAPCLLPAPVDAEGLGTEMAAHHGLWLGRDELKRLAEGGAIGSRRGTSAWIYVSVATPWSVRERRRLGRVLGSPVLTIFGTPATGPVAASHRSWYIEEAAGIPMTGVELFPVDHRGGVVAEPPWPLLSHAGVGVKSSLVTTDMTLEGAAPGGFVGNDVFDTGVEGRIDANGFLYLVA